MSEVSNTKMSWLPWPNALLVAVCLWLNGFFVAMLVWHG